MLFVEYLLLSSPIIAFLIWHHQWIPAVVLLLAPRLIVFIDVKPIIINDTTIVIVSDAQVSYTTKNYVKYD